MTHWRISGLHMFEKIWELEARAESNGHRRGVHREKDSARDDGKHNEKTKTNPNVVLDRYVL